MLALLISAGLLLAQTEPLPAEVVASPPPPVPSADEAGLAASLRRAAELDFSQPVEFPGHQLQVLGSTEAAADASQVLQQMSQSLDAEVRLRAVEAWAALDPQQSLDPLLALLLDTSVKVRIAAARALGESEAARVPLLDLLYRQDFHFLKYAPDLFPPLAKLLGPACLEKLQEIGAPTPDRAMAAYALGLMKYTAAEEAILAGATNADVGLARTCAQALYTLNSGSSEKVWLELAKHPDPEIAAIALTAVARSTSTEARVLLFDMASGKVRAEEALQLRALEGVRAWPDYESIPSLIKVMGNNPRLAPVCNQFLAKKTKEDFGGSPELWGQWWVKMTSPPSFNNTPGQQAAAP